MKMILCVVVTLSFCGCASITDTKLVSAEAVPVYGTTPMVHTAYTGSDQQYHYFSWSRGFRTGKVKVAKSQLKLSREFPHGTGSELVGRSHDGKLELLIKLDGVREDQSRP